MVLATAVPKVKAATKLKNAAQITATRGESTRVETTVAMELAASWKPFRKSKARATAQIRMANPSMVLAWSEPLSTQRWRRLESRLNADGFDQNRMSLNPRATGPSDGRARRPRSRGGPPALW